MGMRLTVTEQLSRNAEFKLRHLAVRVIDPITGYIAKAVKLFATVIKLNPSEIDAKAAEIDALFEVANPRQPQKIFPPTLEVERQTYKRIMIGELTGTEAAQFLKPEEVRGHNQDKLRALLKEPSGEALTYTNVDDAKRYIEAANGQGRKFRFMTDPEFEALPAKVKSQLRGNNWFLVETSRGSDRYYWRSLFNASQGDGNPELRYSYFAFRFVED